jgi:putative endonuclease
MREAKHFYVYIMTNNSRSHVSYTGITGDLPRRVFEHKNKFLIGFTSRYNLTRLVYYEMFSYPGDAIQREKEIKGWVRSKKIKLIESVNPHWHDLAADWENLHKPVDRTPASAREILSGLPATQDDVKRR